MSHISITHDNYSVIKYWLLSIAFLFNFLSSFCLDFFLKFELYVVLIYAAVNFDGLSVANKAPRFMAKVKTDALSTDVSSISSHLGLLQPDVTRQYLSLPKFPSDAKMNGTFDVGKFVAAFNNDTVVDGVEIGSPPPVSMQRVRDHLRGCLTKIKSELVNNINRDYEQVKIIFMQSDLTWVLGEFLWVLFYFVFKGSENLRPSHCSL